MSKVTLEDGAQIVVESIDCLLLNDANYMLAVTPELVDDLKEAITAFRKLEEAE